MANDKLKRLLLQSQHAPWIIDAHFIYKQDVERIAVINVTILQTGLKCMHLFALNYMTDKMYFELGTWLKNDDKREAFLRFFTDMKVHAI